MPTLVVMGPGPLGPLGPLPTFVHLSVHPPLHPTVRQSIHPVEKVRTNNFKDTMSGHRDLHQPQIFNLDAMAMFLEPIHNVVVDVWDILSSFDNFLIDFYLVF